MHETQTGLQQSNYKLYWVYKQFSGIVLGWMTTKKNQIRRQTSTKGALTNS